MECLSFTLIAVLFDAGAHQASLSVPGAVPNVRTAINAAAIIYVSSTPLVVQHQVMMRPVIRAYLLVPAMQLRVAVKACMLFHVESFPIRPCIGVVDATAGAFILQQPT
ncbi:hypothetical protein [Corynebacterium callunae]|uniref:hypothetical protein n=1 Tax=Corynebacterium callunae TaxID=1721 RepID=UPI001FFF664F|nr:hypothetical protein [Corynebacterium callunae]MCK2200191.1 hypothetical protein [Corynebacterium callunae]